MNQTTRNDTKHRIAILCHTGAGGSGIMATELAAALAASGHDIHLIGSSPPFRLESRGMNGSENETYRDLGESPPPLSFWGQIAALAKKSFTNRSNLISPTEKRTSSVHFHEILTHEYPLFESDAHPTLRTANTLASVVERLHIDIVHAHYAIPHSTSAILARDAGLDIKVITTLHGTDVTTVGSDPAYAFTTRHAINCSDAVTAVSQSLIDTAREKLGITRHIERIVNWVDSDRFRPLRDPQTRARYAQPEEAIIVHVSNFRPVKCSHKVIEIFAKICERIPARLFLIGAGPEKQRCLDMSVELGVSGRILSLPPIAEVEKMLGIADVLLLPSSTEAFPLVALEAMACGAVTIASNVGGLPEMIDHTETGYLFAPEDVDGMAEAAVTAIRNTDVKNRICAQARQMVIERYRPEIICQQYDDFYTRLKSS